MYAIWWEWCHLSPSHLLLTTEGTEAHTCDSEVMLLKLHLCPSGLRAFVLYYWQNCPGNEDYHCINCKVTECRGKAQKSEAIQSCRTRLLIRKLWLLSSFHEQHVSPKKQQLFRSRIMTEFRRSSALTKDKFQLINIKVIKVIFIRLLIYMVYTQQVWTGILSKKSHLASHVSTVFIFIRYNQHV